MDAWTAHEKIKQTTQEALVKTHATLVKRIALHLLARLPKTILLDDLMQSGMLGLLEAVRHYDASKGASFETYAGIRIRGYMLDEVRRNDWVPRSVYRNARVISQAIKQVENRTGRDAKDHEVAAVLEVSLDEYHDILNDANGAHLYGFDDVGVTDDQLTSENHLPNNEPHTQALFLDMKVRLSQTIGGLPKKERLALSLYYEHDLNLKEIGEILEVTESRVSQILTQAISRVKARMID